MRYFPNYRKSTPLLTDVPPATTTASRPGRPATPIPPEALERIATLREAGSTFEAIRAALDAEFGLSIGVATLHAVWERDIEPQTPDGQQIARWQRLFGLSKARWRRILADMRKQESASAASSPQDSEHSPSSSPQKSGEAKHD